MPPPEGGGIHTAYGQNNRVGAAARAAPTREMEELYHVFEAYASAYTRMRKNGYHAYEVRSMGVKDAVAARFESICRERKMTINELASRSGVTPSSVYSMMDPSRRNISIVLIKKLCDGLDLTLKQFFDGPEFDGLEQEIR